MTHPIVEGMTEAVTMAKLMRENERLKVRMEEDKIISDLLRAQIDVLHGIIAEEKALGDRLHGDLAKLEALYDALRDKGYIDMVAEDMAIVMRIGHTNAAYRKARGL